MGIEAIKTTEGQFHGVSGQFALVVGRWNSFVVEHLVSGAVDTLKRHGIADEQIQIIRVPGAFEIPLTCQAVAKNTDLSLIHI